MIGQRWPILHAVPTLLLLAWSSGAEALSVRIMSVEGGALDGATITPPGADPGPGVHWPFVQGQTFTIDVTVDVDLPNEAMVHTWTSLVSFDPSVLQLVASQLGIEIFPMVASEAPALCTPTSFCLGGVTLLRVRDEAIQEAPGVYRLGDYGYGPHHSAYEPYVPYVWARLTFEVVASDAAGTPLEFSLGDTLLLQDSGSTNVHEALIITETDIDFPTYVVGRVPEPRWLVQLASGGLLLGVLARTRRA